MAQGNDIVIGGEPKGVFREVIVEGTPKPGVVMQVKASTEPINGTYTFIVATQTDGKQLPIAVLDIDKLQGKTATDAYVTGTRGTVYYPIAGEELNMILQDVSGTGDDHAIGDHLMVDSGTGKLIAPSSEESNPFVCMETVTDPVADTLAHVLYSGH